MRWSANARYSEVSVLSLVTSVHHNTQLVLNPVRHIQPVELVVYLQVTIEFSSVTYAAFHSGAPAAFQARVSKHFV